MWGEVIDRTNSDPLTSARSLTFWRHTTIDFEKHVSSHTTFSLRAVLIMCTKTLLWWKLNNNFAICTHFKCFLSFFFLSPFAVIFFTFLFWLPHHISSLCMFFFAAAALASPLPFHTRIVKEKRQKRCWNTTSVVKQHDREYMERNRKLWEIMWRSWSSHDRQDNLQLRKWEKELNLTGDLLSKHIQYIHQLFLGPHHAHRTSFLVLQ